MASENDGDSVSQSIQAQRCPCEDARPFNDGSAADRREFDGWVTRLVHAHRARLVAVARHEGLAAEDAFDAAQEAFATFLILPRAQELAGGDDAAPTLVALARNVARNARRLHVVGRPHESDAAVVEALADAAPPPDARLAAAEERGRLARCVARLADAQRAVVTLRMLDDVPGEDVARALGLRPGHVAVLLHRAKASLRACMTEEPVATNADPQRQSQPRSP
jgi:RNA polymerase sigma-70 factor (ECF subfamily)